MSRPDAVALPVVGGAPGAPERALEELFGAGAATRPLHALDDGPGSAAAGDALLEVLERLRRYRVGGPSEVVSLEGLEPDALARLSEALGEGEVQLTVRGRHTFEIRETGLPGLWRVRGADEDGAPRGDFLEVGDVPAVVRAADAEATRTALEVGEPPEGAMNVRAVLTELRHRMGAWAQGQPNHVVSFTLLPMSEVDMRHLERQLEHGPVAGESKGYGLCRVELTGRRHVWSVQYFNASGALVLDTLEVGDVPLALVAGAEDFEDSAQRLAELLGV